MSPGSYFTIIIFINILGDVHSDVISSTQSISLMSSPRKPCKIPYSNQHYYMSFEGNRLEPNKSIDGCGKIAVNVKCFDTTRKVKPDDFAVCFDGQWYPSDHTCVQEKCVPILDTYSTRYTCTTPKGVERSCEEPAEPGTKMTQRCVSKWYRFKNVNREQTTFCLKSGQWERDQRCKVDCDQGLIKNISLEDNNKSSSKVPNQYYWHAAIFHQKDGKWDQVCVGTLVSNVYVITAGNCFQGDWKDNRKIEKEIEERRLKVGVGKNSRDYLKYAPSQVYDVKGIFKSSNSSNEAPDIILLVVDRYIPFSDTVGNVCFNLILRNVKLNGRNGHIVAWTNNDNSAIKEMESLQWMTNEECQISKDVSGNIRANEFCSLSNNHKFLPNDIGAGLVVSSEGFYDMLGLLSDIMLDGQIPVFLNMSNARIRPLINELWKRSDEWLKKTNKNWWIRHKDDSK